MLLIQLDGRVVVDAASYFDNHAGPRLFLDALGTKSAAPQIEVEDQGHVYGYPDYDGRAGRAPPSPPPPPPMRPMPPMRPPPPMRPLRPMRPIPPTHRDQFMRQRMMEDGHLPPLISGKKETSK